MSTLTFTPTALVESEYTDESGHVTVTREGLYADADGAASDLARLIGLHTDAHPGRWSDPEEYGGETWSRERYTGERVTFYVVPL
jgi:hypothetical protein